MDDAAPLEQSEPRPRIGNLLWHHLWTAALAANLVVPMSVARDMARGGEIGMALAVGVLWLIGDLAGVRWAWLRPVLLKGAVVVALTQFAPILQITAGLVGVGVAGLSLGLHEDAPFPPPPASAVRVFAATFITGGLLLFASLVAGLISSPSLLRRCLERLADRRESPL
jgi:hypothetical protein